MRKIIVVNPFGIGDVIFSMQLVEALRQAFPDALIGFVCNERTKELVRMNRSIDRTFIFNRDLFRRVWRRSPFLFFKTLKGFLKLLKTERFETLVDLSLGREYSFFSMLIGIRQRIGFDFKNRGIFLTQKIKIDGYAGRAVADIHMDLLNFFGLAKKDAPRVRLVVGDTARTGAEEKILAVAPGGGRSWGDNAIYKQWDPQWFAEAVNRLTENHSFEVLVLGDKAERDLLQKTAGLIHAKTVVIAGEPLDKVSVLLSRVSLLLCNDGGLMHLANALGVKTVSVFGPVDEKVYGPTPNGTPHEVLTEPVPCRPCYQKFVFPPCPYERRCLDQLSVEKVVQAMHKIL